MSWDTFKTLDDAFRLEKQFARFETEEASLREDHHRQMSALKMLASGDSLNLINEHELRRLVEKLGTGISTGRHAKSLASSFSMRSLRRSHIGATMKLFAPFPNESLIAFTALNQAWVLSPQKLLNTTASSIKEQFARDLRRAGVDGPLVAFIHGEFDSVNEQFTAHVHGTCLRDELFNLRSLGGRWGYVPSVSGATAIKCDAVVDRIAQFSYLEKSFWPERDIFVVDDHVSRARNPLRMREPFHSLYLIWLDRQSPKGMSLWWDVRSEAGKEREQKLLEIASRMQGFSQ